MFHGPAPVDLSVVVRARHRAEGAEWLALFRLYRAEGDRLARQRDGGLQRDPDHMRIQAAEAACARWCVSAPETIAATRFRLRAAIQLFEHLPLTAQAFMDGLVPARLVKQIVDRTYAVEIDLLPGLDAALRGELIEPLAGGARMSSKGVDSAVDEIVMQLDPAGVRTVRRAARAGCGVSMESLPGGVARLVAVLPGAAGAAVFATIDALARRLHQRRPVDADGDRLSLDRCRAVALLVLAAGRGALATAGLSDDSTRTVDGEAAKAGAGGSGGSGGSGAGVQVMVHATQEAVESPSDAVPVWISRLGLLPSTAVAGLLASAPRITPRAGPRDQLRPTDPLSWLTSPLTPPDPHDFDLAGARMPDGSGVTAGPANRAERRAEDLARKRAEKRAVKRDLRRALADVMRDRVPRYALRYRIPEWLRVKVQLRDGCCRFPGCSVPAEDCDVDHLEPFLHRDPLSGGWTIELNLGCLCRRHHRIKTHDKWTVTTSLDGVFTFTAPDGTTAVTYPQGPAARIGLAGRIHGPPDPDEYGPGPDLRAPEPDLLDPGPTAEQHEQWYRQARAYAKAQGWDHDDHIPRPDPEDMAA